MTFDENDLHAGLRALTAAPPPAPPERAVRSIRRLRVIRARRAGVAALVVCALAVPVVAFVGRPSTHARPAGPIETWPDRRNPKYLAETENVLQFARVETVPEDASLPVRWLYADEVPGTGGLVAAAWAYCAPDGCRQVVLAVGHPGASSRLLWTFASSGTVEPGAPQRPFGWYFRGRGGKENVLFALGPPAAETLTYAAGGASGTLHGHDGVFAGSLGWVSAAPRVRILDRHHRVLAEGALRVPGAPVDSTAHRQPLPRLAEVPSGYRIATTYEWQTGLFDEPGPGGVAVPPGSTFRVFARCLGAGDMTVLDAGGERFIHIPCDGVVHPGWPDERARASHWEVRVEGTDPYTVYALAVGVR